jgi:hypothetical protein
MQPAKINVQLHFISLQHISHSEIQIRLNTDNFQETVPSLSGLSLSGSQG